MGISDRPIVTVTGSDRPTGPDLLGSPVAPERQRDWRAVLVAVTGVTAVGIAGTGIALAVGLSGGGPQPEDVLPGDVFAMVKVDLDPSGDQKIAAYRLAERFPDLGVDADRELADDLLRRLFAESDDVDYDRQVQPWIGARAAVAGMPDADDDGHPEALVALAYDDRAAAERELPGLMQAAGDGEPAFFAFSDRASYVLLAQSQAAADAAADPAAVLADASSFAADVDVLDGDQVAVAWVDVGAAWRSVDAKTQELAAASYGGELDPSGRMVMGLHLENDAVELAGRGFGLDFGNDALTAYALGAEGGDGLVRELPEGAAAAMSVAGLDAQVQALVELFATAGLGAGGGEEAISAIEEQFGIAVPEDVAILLGAETAAAVYDVDGQPQFGVRNRVDDPDRSLAVAQRLLAAASQLGASAGGYTYEQCVQEYVGVPAGGATPEELCTGLPAEAAAPPDVAALGALAPVDGGIAYASTPALLDRMTTQGGLGDSAAFRRAVPDGQDAASVVFVDLPALLPLLGLQRDELSALESFGATTSGGPDGGFRLRLTVR